MDTARLHVVATPIGNLDDISLRALDVLAKVDIVAAEDTRHTRLLLTRHDIDRPLLALHEHNEDRQAPQLVKSLLQGKSVALVSDAGTPLVSDPGYRLVQLAAEQGIEVVAVPGPSAVTAALSVCGLPTDRFVFEGFLASKSTARQKRLASLKTEPRTMVFYESSHRIQACLADMADAFGADRRVAVCRELTKRFETVLRGTLGEVLAAVQNDPDQRRGEFALVVEGSSVNRGEALGQAITLAEALKEHVGVSQAARIAARIHDVSRRDIYGAMSSD
jgi:16S rRNA (cytidine1402-2'-O)-methyltransferase